MAFNRIDDNVVFTVLLGNLCAEFHMGTFLLKVDRLSDVMQKSCTFCELLVESELSGHDARKCRNFHGMFKHILSVAVTVAEPSDKLCKLAVQTVDAEFEHRLITDLGNGLIQFTGYLVYDFFNPARLDTSVLHQLFE